MSSFLISSGPAQAAHSHKPNRFGSDSAWNCRAVLPLVICRCDAFAILFFFAITGFTLNHADWFSKQQRTIQVRGAMDPKFLTKDVAKLEVVEYLRNTHGIHGAVSDFRVEDTDCAVAFKGPGYSADVLIDRSTGQYELTEAPHGLGGRAQ